MCNAAGRFRPAVRTGSRRDEPTPRLSFQIFVSIPRAELIILRPQNLYLRPVEILAPPLLRSICRHVRGRTTRAKNGQCKGARARPALFKRGSREGRFSRPKGNRTAPRRCGTPGSAPSFLRYSHRPAVFRGTELPSLRDSLDFRQGTASAVP